MTVATAANPPRLFAPSGEAIGADTTTIRFPRLGPQPAFDIEFGPAQRQHLQTPFLGAGWRTA